MSASVATPKQTSGEGFTFEDKVGAYYALWLLRGGAPFGPEYGELVRIDFQTRADGWLLDDLLLTLRCGSSACHAAFSIRSNPQFTRTSAPADFVEAVWKHYLHEGTDCFSAEADSLGIVTAPLPDPPKTAIQSLLRKAREQDSVLLVQRVQEPGYASAEERALFSSFQCPEGLSRSDGTSPADSATLLSRLLVREFDFGTSPSTDEAESVQTSRDLLEGPSLADATHLWQALLAVVNEARTPGGYLDRGRLLAKLRPHHRLRQLPDFASDWDRLQTRSRETIGAVSCRIGRDLTLPRDEALQELRSELERYPAVALTGPSGCGKTALTKLLAEASGEGAAVLWIEPDWVSHGVIDACNQRLGLPHDAAQVLPMLASSHGLIVIDGLEHMTQDSAFHQLGALLNSLHLPDADSPWRVVVTCQTAHWSRINDRIASCTTPPVPWQVHPVPMLADDDLKLVRERYPYLGPLLLRQGIADLLKSPKVLDIVAQGIEHGSFSEEPKWVGESDLIEWFCQHVVRGEPAPEASARLFLALAERQADEGVSRTPVHALSAQEATALESLKQKGICEVRDDAVRFAHDLYGDWARQRVILSHKEDRSAYVEERVAKPHWHRAIQLHGQYLLERNPDATSWREQLRALGFAQDLLLDAVVLATNSWQFLEQLWPELEADNGTLLNRLLRRFLHVATFPNPMLTALSERLGSYARIHDRVPYWPLWPAMVYWLHGHLADVVRLAPTSVALIAQKWLQHAPSGTPWRRHEAAEIALAVGEATYEARKGRPYRKDEDDCTAYRAALAATPELPEEVADLALRACSRRLPDDVLRGEVGDYKPPGTVSVTHFLGHPDRQVMPGPWPDGPACRVDEAFQKACIEQGALIPMMRCKPDIAREAILALVIDRPTPSAPPGYDFHGLHEDYSLDDFSFFTWPSWSSGPFIAFLKINAEHGLDTISRLVDFATDRWAEGVQRPGDKAYRVEVCVDGATRQFVGDFKVFFWHRGAAWYPLAAASALMALEKWLYLRIDAGEPIDDWLLQVLRKSTSVAFLGLLCEVARYKPDLLRSVLRPLVPIPEVYEWEIRHQREMLQAASFASPLHSRWLMEQHREWCGMPHRQGRFLHCALQLLFAEADEPFFAEVRRSWQGRLDAARDNEGMRMTLENLMVQFNRQNWHPIRFPDGRAGIECVRPHELEEKAAAIAEDAQQHLRMLGFPLRCRELLEGGTPMPPEQLEGFWAEIQHLAGPLPEALRANEADVLSSEACICGGIAVLVKLHRQWLKEHPDREQWCKQNLLATITHAPARKAFDCEEAVGDYDWDHFAAEVVPVLWAEDSASPEWTAAIARLTTAYHYGALHIMMRNAFNLRDRLGDRYDQLVNLVLHWAELRWRCYLAERDRHARESLGLGPARWLRLGKHLLRLLQNHVFVKSPFVRTYPHRPVNAERRFRRLSKSFARGRLAPRMAEWGTRAVASGEFRGGHRRRVVVMPCIDFETIMYAFASIMRPDQASNTRERENWIRFWDQTCQCVLARLRTSDWDAKSATDDYENPGTPYEYERWFFRLAAQLTMQLENTENPSRYWQPILELGSRAQYWVEIFCAEWVSTGLSSQGDARFVEHWQTMCKFAESAWWDEPSRRRHDARKLWLHLLGLDPFALHLWKEEHRPTVTKMKPHYASWATANLPDHDSALRFARWLCNPASTPLLLDALCWLRDTAMQADNRWWWRESELEDAVSEMLDECWRSHREQLSAKPEALSAFRELTQILAERHNPLALDLQMRVARGE